MPITLFASSHSHCEASRLDDRARKSPARVVAEDVDLAELGFSIVRCRLEGVAVGDVEAGSPHPCALQRDLGSGRFKSLGFRPGDGDRDTVLRQRLGDAQPDATGATRDERGAANKCLHVSHSRS